MNLIKEELIIKAEAIVKRGVKIYNKSNLIYDSKFNFLKNRIIHKYNDLSFNSKQNSLISFYYELIELKNLIPQKSGTKSKRCKLYNTATRLYNK